MLWRSHACDAPSGEGCSGVHGARICLGHDAPDIRQGKFMNKTCLSTDSAILGRPWLRSTNAVGFYSCDEYCLQDKAGLHRKIEYVGPSSVPTPEVFIAEGIDFTGLSHSVDESTMTDLEYTLNQRTDAILAQIIANCEDESWDDYEEEMEMMQSQQMIDQWQYGQQGKGKPLL